MPGAGYRLESRVEGPDAFRLAFWRGDDLLVEYLPGRRRVRGRQADYAFRSIEQLRYDFEKDVRDAGFA